MAREQLPKLLPLKLRQLCRDQSCSGRLITTLAGIKTGHPQTCDATVWHECWWCHISFDGIWGWWFFFRFLRVVYNLLHHQRSCIDLALVKLGISGNLLDSSDGFVKNVLCSGGGVFFSLCILLSHSVTAVPVRVRSQKSRNLEIQFGTETAFLLLFGCVKVFRLVSAEMIYRDSPALISGEPPISLDTLDWEKTLRLFLS